MLGTQRVTSRAASASPSVSLEKGKYRMRAPTSRSPLPPPKLSPNNGRTHTRPSTGQNNAYVTVLLLLLASGCVVSFGLAYYLFTTRWANSNQPSRLKFADDETQVVQVEAPQTACPSIAPGEKFLAYHTHSGFHNQRIALENALTLSHLLNRTLVIPPIRVGKPIHYCNFHALHQFLSLSDKVGLQHCARLSPGSFLPPECLGYFEYTHLPWDWLLDFAQIGARHRYIFRGNHSDQWIRGCLGVDESDVLVLQESSRYQYRFLDAPTSNSADSSDKFAEAISIPQLRDSREPLIQLGTLFGTTRLLLIGKENYAIRRRVREEMVFTNSLLAEISESIVERLGDIFVGAHVRLGDGGFAKSGKDNAHSIWWTLVQVAFNLTLDETIALQTSDSTTSGVSPPILAPYAIHSAAPPQSILPSPLRCHKPLYTQPSLKPLNTPLYLATDAREPRNDSSLTLFFRTFPCVFTLADVEDLLEPLDHVVNGLDGVKLKPFLMPFIDTMVLGKAWSVVGTTSSTFSAFALEVLWPIYHGLEMKERG
ncbi:hypothetical protein V5O48_002249 [Marasmius crinis-equi]|uniref:Uncharacterized protein n=1 Tax=Marasmius crinis-equi TaxID=585013 RepID=A0ABR3FW63_9AGAR